MRLVVINTAKSTYRVFEGRQLVAEYQAFGEVPTAEQVEEIRLAVPTPLETA